MFHRSSHCREVTTKILSRFTGYKDFSTDVIYVSTLCRGTEIIFVWELSYTAAFQVNLLIHYVFKDLVLMMCITSMIWDLYSEVWSSWRFIRTVSKRLKSTFSGDVVSQVKSRTHGILNWLPILPVTEDFSGPRRRARRTWTDEN